MQYTPKELKGNVNISPKSPLRDLLSMSLSLLGILLIIYIALGFVVDIIAPRLPEGIEKNLGKPYLAMYKNKLLQGGPVNKKVQNLLNSLTKETHDSKKYNLYLIEDKLVNAIALPGRNIIVFSGLLKEVKTENELAFILAHELGHFANKDHLRGLGRGLVFFILSSALLGPDNSVSDFLGNFLTKVEMKFSQTQEKNADIFALKLLNKKYGHVGAVTDFFKKIKEKEKIPKFFYFFATHPHPQKRINILEEKIKEKGYSVKPAKPVIYIKDEWGKIYDSPVKKN